MTTSFILGTIALSLKAISGGFQRCYCVPCWNQYEYFGYGFIWQMVLAAQALNMHNWYRLDIFITCANLFRKESFIGIVQIMMYVYWYNWLVNILLMLYLLQRCFFLWNSDFAMIYLLRTKREKRLWCWWNWACQTQSFSLIEAICFESCVVVLWYVK